MTLRKIDENMIDDKFTKKVSDLKNKSDELASSLADTAKQTDLDTTNNTIALKAEKTEVITLARDKADKAYVDMNVSSLDTKINSQASGSPKGTYATLALLQAAFPTGNSNIYVVTADGNWYYWSGLAWIAGGAYQSTGIANGSINANKVDDYIYKNIVQVEKTLGSISESVTIDSKDLALITTPVSNRLNETRILEAPSTTFGLVTLKAEFLDERDIDILILEKGTGTQFRTIKRQTVHVFAGFNSIETDLVIEVGQYVGVYAYSNLKYLAVSNKTGYVYAGDISSSFITTTRQTTFDLSYYYSVGGKESLVEQIKNDATVIKDELNLYNTQATIDQRDLSLFTTTTNDVVTGTFRINENPATAIGQVKIHVITAISSNLEVFIFEKQVGINSFKKVGSEIVKVVTGVNVIQTNLIVREGQYVGVLSKNNLKYLNKSGVVSYSLAYTEISSFTQFNRSTILSYGFYYEITPTKSVIKLLKDNVEDVKTTIDDIISKTRLHKSINTIYAEKFIGNVLPTPPFGSWLLNGAGVVSDGIALTPAIDWSSYLQLTQRSHFDSDGVKWRVKLNDITSKIRVERRTSPTPLGFSSTAELDSGKLKIYQSEITANGIPSIVLASKTVSFILVAGREYSLSLETFGEILTFKIADTVTGKIDALSFDSTSKGAQNAGRGWDYPRFYVASGNAKIIQFDYFSRLPRSPKAIITGDSILEADTIRNLTGGGYKNRWAGKLYDALQGDVVILGTAGETSTGIFQKIPVINKVLKEPEYALLAHMTNDTDFTTWKTNTEQLIQALTTMGAIPVICMMPMRAGRESFYDAVLDYVVKCPYKVIWFNRALTINGDGKTLDAQYYTGDMLHPNVVGHARMFEQVQADLEEIFPLSY